MLVGFSFQQAASPITIDVNFWSNEKSVGSGFHRENTHNLLMQFFNYAFANIHYKQENLRIKVLSD